MEHFIHGTNSSDSRLIAALTAMGIFCDEKSGSGAINTGGNTVRVWSISEVSNCGKWRSKELIQWWRDQSFHVTNPQHPFAYVKCALWNHKQIVAGIKMDKPLVLVEKGDSFAYLHPDCSSETERKILSQFDQ